MSEGDGSPRAVPAPDFVIVGAERCGTTYLHACLAEHPGLFMPHGEVSYFERRHPTAEETADAIARLAGAAPDQLVGTRGTTYLAQAEVAARIARARPDVRLIAILRNPIDRAVSAYFHNIRYGFAPALPLERGLRDLMHAPYDGRYRRAREIIDLGFYGRQLQAYLRHFSRPQLHVLTYEDIVASPLATIQRVYDFLGVDATYSPEGVGRRFNEGVVSLPRLRLLALANRLCYVYNDDRTRLYPKEPTRAVRLAFVALRTIDVMSRPLTRRAARPASPELREALHGVYRDDVDVLSELRLLPLIPWVEFEAAAGGAAA